MPEEKEAISAELELDGTVYYIEKDGDGNVILKKELPNQVVVNALATFFNDAVEDFAVDEDEEVFEIQ